MVDSDVRADIARLQLSEGQRRYCLYLVAYDGNEDMACRHAGIGSSDRFRSNPVVQDYIEYLVERRSLIVQEEENVLRTAPISKEEITQTLGSVFRGEQPLTEDAEKAARLLISGKLLTPALKRSLVSIHEIVRQSEQEEVLG